MATTPCKLTRSNWRAQARGARRNVAARAFLSVLEVGQTFAHAGRIDRRVHWAKLNTAGMEGWDLAAATTSQGGTGWGIWCLKRAK